MGQSSGQTKLIHYEYGVITRWISICFQAKYWLGRLVDMTDLEIKCAGWPSLDFACISLRLCVLLLLILYTLLFCEE